MRAKGVAELSSLKHYNRSKRGMFHHVDHYVGQIPMAAITENRFGDRVITNFVRGIENNSTMRWKLVNRCHRFVHTCL